MTRAPGLVNCLCIGLLVALVLPAAQGSAARFTVNKTADTSDGLCDNDCSLREAITEANQSSGPDQVTIPSGTYLLTLVGTDEDAAATGDLDITGDLTLVGNGADVTIIDGNATDRVFHVLGNTNVSIAEITIQNRAIEQHGDAWTRDIGGGILITEKATLTLMNSTLRYNSAQLLGGGIYSTGRVSVMNSTVSGNASNRGGGVYSAGSLMVTSSTLIGNSATHGGGIYSTGDLFVTSSTLTGNGAASTGGGINNSGGIAEVTNSTLSGNEAGFGGAIDNTGKLSLFDSTVTDNRAYFGITGTVILANTILANSVSPPFYGRNCGEGIIWGHTLLITSRGYNLDDDGSCGLTADGDLSNVEAGLGPLGDYGGVTETHALLADSPAVDAGDNDNCPSGDQRGVVRAQGAGCDIGAFELAVKDCGDGLLDFGEQCDDGNLLDGDGCSSVCGIECGNGAVDPNEECDDSNVLDDDGCSSACGIEWCTVATKWGCRTASKSALLLRQQNAGSGDRLIWKLSRGEATNQQEFSDPTSSTDYLLCVDSHASQVAECVVAASSTRWDAVKGRGYKYKDLSGSEDGVRRVLLKGSDRDNTKVLVKGSGANLPDPTLPLELPVTVRLVNADTGVCWESTFEEGDVMKNEAGIFKARK